ncbi:CASP-like protein 5A1 [Actinidia eriantha]|uniref:CASP-like protein 5A1 n=1 Tax=Actinidia eriantha TaxID=165200 RepID=UPI0025857AF7|nr:CASP-like protein 5A1 [Actinidia eriantha]
MSYPSLHPLEGAPPLTNGGNRLPRVRMKDIQGMPGIPSSLALRMCHFGFAIVVLSVMATTSDFATVTAFRYLVAAVSL